MSATVAVLGAAGKTGRAVTAALAARGIAVRAWVHRPGQVEEGVDGAARVDVIDMTSPTAIRAGLTGCDAAYLIAPNMHPDERAFLAPVLAACADAGPVGASIAVVYHSVIHPYLPAMPHHVAKAEVEASLHGSGLEWAVLQPASYFENALGVWDSISRDGVWPLPYAADALFTPVALRDVAAAAAIVLDDLARGSGAHRYATYELAGPEVLSTAEMARVAGELLGRQVTVAVDRDPGRAAARPPRLQAMFDYYHEHGICGNPSVLAMLLGGAGGVGGATGAGSVPTDWRSWCAAQIAAESH